MEQNFIKTSDSNTAEKLKNEGFTLLNKDINGFFTFINDGKMLFNDEEEIIFTNKIEL